jgi:hypothetical protein
VVARRWRRASAATAAAREAADSSTARERQLGEANRTQRPTILLALQEETKALLLLEEVRALEVEDT